ncbi:putative flippase GtrA [Arcanobacterium wilhelmae]|uniref:Flippase GtrA n=1 Tax=Arcanobacterium wilhelmae TaxID=1803177 RepID=A0ABT9NDA9_9ACTO|nr:GtrA family protein [Arcanobacterium wilhelmae]MDP9801712.1 putative flippase GtrA [Arcanobacterium wilhelmae]WFN91031.1 GtrA family protein [Arcanobacterium wilhelmae]
MNRLFAQISRFGIVGVLATVLDFALLWFLVSVTGLNYLVSATVAYCISLVFNYVASMRYVFARRSDLRRSREFTIFVVLALFGLILNNLTMWLLTGVIGLNYMASKVFATAIVMVWNFVSRKKTLESRE